MKCSSKASLGRFSNVCIFLLHVPRNVLYINIYVAGQNEIQVKMKFLRLLILIIHRS